MLLLWDVSITEYTYQICTSLFQLGYAVAQLVEAVRYMPEDHGFNSQLFHWDFSLT
jgi:hypothetical protein